MGKLFDYLKTIGYESDGESIVLNKAIIRDREWQAKTSFNPRDYDRISNDAQARLEYDDKNKMQNLIDFTTGSGPAAIQKLGSGQVYGKLAKAVRKMLSNKNMDLKSNDIVSVIRVNSPRFVLDNAGSYKTTFPMLTETIAKTNLDTKLNQGLENIAGTYRHYKGGVGKIRINNELSEDFKKFAEQHEIGHSLNRYLHPDASMMDDMKMMIDKGNYNSSIKEGQANAFAEFITGQKQPYKFDRSVTDQMKQMYNNLFENTIINTYPK